MKTEKEIKRRDHANKRPENTGDTPEMIQRCLNCERPECCNCYVTLKRHKRDIDLRKRPSDFVEKFMRAYITCKNDGELCSVLGRSQSVISKYRLSLDFPAPSYTPIEERRRLVNEWRQRTG